MQNFLVLNENEMKSLAEKCEWMTIYEAERMAKEIVEEDEEINILYIVEVRSVIRPVRVRSALFEQFDDGHRASLPDIMTSGWNDR